MGLADVENGVLCHPDTVMRIASISKSMTMAVVARLWQEGKLDLDKPVQHYVPSFPNKKFDKQEVAIMLFSRTWINIHDLHDRHISFITCIQLMLKFMARPETFSMMEAVIAPICNVTQLWSF